MRVMRQTYAGQLHVAQTSAPQGPHYSITAGERSEPAEGNPIHLRPQEGRTTEQMPSPHATLPPQARCATAPPHHEASERRAAAKRSNYSITAGERSEPAEGSPHPPSAPRGSNHSEADRPPISILPDDANAPHAGVGPPWGPHSHATPIRGFAQLTLGYRIVRPLCGRSPRP